MGRLRGGISKRKQSKSGKPVVFTMDLEEHTDHVQSSFVSHSIVGRRHRSIFISRVSICSWKICRFRDAKREISKKYRKEPRRALLVSRAYMRRRD